MQPIKRSYLELHFAIFLFAFTAILGDLIQLTALVLVWWRVFITVISLLLLVRVVKIFKELPREKILGLAGIGVLVAMQWLTFYGAIKLSNASIALVCLATVPFLTALVEPLVLRKRIKWIQVGIGLFVIPGMSLIVNSTELVMLPGIWVGLSSAIFVAFFVAFNKKMIGVTDELSMTCIELSSAFFFLSLFMPFYFFFSGDVVFFPKGIDWFYLIILALVCTTLAYVLTLRALRHISAFAANLTINLEPIYGIILAVILLKENKELSRDFYIGALILMLAVFSYPYLTRRKRLAKFS